MIFIHYFKTKLNVLLLLILPNFMFMILNFSQVFAYSNPDFFLKQGVGARQLGMGNAGTAVCDDASAIFFNPAGLAYLKNVELASMHSEAYDFDIKYDYISLILPIVRGRVLGVSGAVLKTDQIPITKDKIPNIVNYVEDKEQVVMVSYGHRISRHAALGLTLKDIKQYLYFKEATGNELDVGILYTPSKTVSLGLNLQDVLPSELKWSTGVSDVIPLTIRGGIAFKIPDWGSIIAIDADKVEGRKIKINGGWEYQFNEAFIGRLGVNDGQGTIGFSLLKYNWRFDYAYMKADLGEVQRFSATTRFGSYLFENIWHRFKRPTKPQCDDPKLKLTNNAKCDKTIDVNSNCSNGKCNENVKSKIASYPSSSSIPLNVPNSVVTPQPDINKVLASDQSPYIPTPTSKSNTKGVRLPDEKMKEGNKLLLAGRYDEAVRAFREALNMKPDLEEAHIKLAGIYQYQKLYVEAIEEYKDAIAINPTNVNNYLSVASLYAKIGEFDKAAEACEIIMKMAPDSPQAKTAKNLYENFKLKVPASDSKVLLSPSNIEKLNFEEDANQKIYVDNKKSKSSSKTKKTSSKSTIKPPKQKENSQSEQKLKQTKTQTKSTSNITKNNTYQIGRNTIIKSDILED